MTTLTPAIRAAIGRAAKPIKSYTSCDRAGMECIITEEMAATIARANRRRPKRKPIHFHP